MNPEETWNTFKTALQNVLRELRAIRKIGNEQRKATAWWSEKVMEAIENLKKKN